MKLSSQVISHLLLAAWIIVLAGPAVVPLEDAISSLLAGDGAGDCCCDDVCICETHDSQEDSCAPVRESAHKAPCVNTTTLFTGIGLTAAGFYLPQDMRVERRAVTDTSEPEQVILNTLQHPPQFSFSV